MSVNVEIATTPNAELPVTTMVAEAPQISPAAIDEPGVTPRFGAGKAVFAFIILIGAQFVAGIGVMVLAVMFAVVRGENLNDPALINRLMSAAGAPLLVVSGVASAGAALLAARLWAWPLVLDASHAGIGFARPRRRHVLLASTAGILLGAAYLGVVKWIVPYDATTPAGPLAAAATGGPMNFAAFAVLALLFAPVVEEFFFRGLLLKGFSTTWGGSVGGIAVTTLFVLLHLTETFRYWPATAAVTVMAVGTLFARTMTGSLVPAIALHAAYNFVIVIVVLVARSTA